MKNLFFLLITVAGLSCSHKLAPDAGWGRGRWVLVEMKKVPVQQSGSRRDAYIDFNVNQKTFGGNGGCNQLSGNYTISKKDVKFNNVISTKMSCSDIDFENTFLSLLAEIEHYELKGDDLLLKKRRETLLVLRAR